MSELAVGRALNCYAGLRDWPVRPAVLASALLVVVAGVALFALLRAKDDSVPFDRDTWMQSAKLLRK